MAENYIDIHSNIVEMCRLGDKKAQYDLYKLYAKAMYNICYRMLNNREEAEDMLQEAFCEAFKKLSSFRNESSFGAWLKTIVINKCINELKRKKADLVLTDDFSPFGLTENNETDDSHIQFEVAKVRKAMEQLPDGFRVIFSLYLLEGYDHTEISQIMNISESTSKTQYLRAKQRVKELVEKM